MFISNSVLGLKLLKYLRCKNQWIVIMEDDYGCTEVKREWWIKSIPWNFIDLPSKNAQR